MKLYAHRLAFRHVCVYIHITSLALGFYYEYKILKNDLYSPFMCMKMLTAQLSFPEQRHTECTEECFVKSELHMEELLLKSLIISTFIV